MRKSGDRGQAVAGEGRAGPNVLDKGKPYIPHIVKTIPSCEKTEGLSLLLSFSRPPARSLPPAPGGSPRPAGASGEHSGTPQGARGPTRLSRGVEEVPRATRGPYLAVALPVPRRVADVGRVGDHVGPVDVVDGLALRQGSQVSVVEDLIAQLRLPRARRAQLDPAPGGSVGESPARAPVPARAKWLRGRAPHDHVGCVPTPGHRTATVALRRCLL